MRGHTEGIPVVLGSATPSLESWLNVKRRKHYRLIRLPQRVRGQAAPNLTIVDMNEEHRDRRGVHMLSRAMEAGLNQTLDRGEQAVLLLNRRGYASYVHCPVCRTPMTCPNCDVRLVYHESTRQAQCHYCRTSKKVPERCPMLDCDGRMVKFGLGTERVEEELGRKFPQARVRRIDSDAMTKSSDYAEILGSFERREFDLLVGTQMVAKGLDFPFVSFVGIVSADTALAFDDFRAEERTFQLVLQVAGRSGRGDTAGNVIVQTFAADTAPIRHAVQGDYEAFANEELERRRLTGLPPFTRMVLGHEVETKDEVDNLGDNIAGALAGEKGKAKNSNAVFLRSETILWTKQHYKNEYKLIVPDRIRFDVGDEPNNGTRVSDEQLPVNLLSVSMPVQWRIRPGDAEVIKFHRQSQDAAAIVEALAYRELTRYAANADIKEFLGDGGLAAASIIHERLQEACDAGGYSNEGLGIEIVYVGLGGIHPPPDQDVAKSYESVVSAIERKETLIKKATAEANELRIEMAGLNWEEIYSAVVDEEKARRTEAADAEEKTDAVVTLLREQSGGNVREMVSAAESSSYARLFNEKSSAELYDAQVASYNAGPHTYLLRVYLRTIEDAIRPVRKYVVAMANPENVIYEIDLKPPSELNIMNAEIAKVDATQTDLDGN